MTTDAAIEAELQSKGLTAEHRLTPERIQATIVGEDYYVFPGTTLTICALRLRNGFISVGQSACINPANFDLEMGRKIARQNAVDKIWELESYLLHERQATQTP